MGKVTVLLLLLAVSGCTMFGQSKAVELSPKAAWCSVNEPWRPSIEEIIGMSRATKEPMLSHNQQGAAWCGWEPKGLRP